MITRLKDQCTHQTVKFSFTQQLYLVKCDTMNEIVTQLINYDEKKVKGKELEVTL